MEETLVTAAIDLSGRYCLVFQAPIPAPKIGEFDSELVEDFWQAVAANALCNLHVIAALRPQQPPHQRSDLQSHGPRAADGGRARPAHDRRAEHEGHAERVQLSELTYRRCRRSLLVDVRFQEPRQPVEVGIRLDVADDGHQRFRIDQLFERHVVQLELARRPRPSRR